MTTSITIRDVPDETRDELAARAARNGQSLQEYLRRQLMALSEKPDLNSVLKRIADRKRATGSELSAETILFHRDAGRE